MLSEAQKKNIQDAYEKQLQRVDERKRIINEITSRKNLEELFNFLSEHKNFSKLGIAHEVLSISLKSTLHDILSDLKDYHRFAFEPVPSPSEFKTQTSSIVKSIQDIKKLFKKSPMIGGMMTLILEEDENLQTTTVETFVKQASIIQKQLEILYSTVNLDLIAAYRLEKVHPDKRVFFIQVSEVQNRLLFITASHIARLADKLGIDSRNGKAHFISHACKPINNSIGKYFHHLGTLEVPPKVLTELFRSKSWACLHGK